MSSSPLHQLFQHLALNYSPFDSEIVVRLDDLVVHSLFGQQTPKKRCRTHAIQKIGLEFVEDQKLSSAIYTAFEEKKPRLEISNLSRYISTIKGLSLGLHRSNSTVKRLGLGAYKALEWMLLAYSMVIHPSCAVKLRVTRTGPGDTLGFSIFATKDIKRNDPIYELTGAMPEDSKTPHSELSAITPHSDHCLPDQAARVLFGPARFVNHLCKDFNTEFICEQNTVAFYACATRDILAGEEITSDYGPNYFEVCPRATCNPGIPRTEARPGKREANRSEEDIERERQGKKKTKRARQKARRKGPTLGSGDQSYWVDGMQGDVSGECGLGERDGS